MIPCTTAVPLASFFGMISVLSPDGLEPSHLESIPSGSNHPPKADEIPFTSLHEAASHYDQIKSEGND